MSKKTGRKSPVQKGDPKQGNTNPALMPRSTTVFSGLFDKPYYNSEFTDQSISKSPVLGRIDNSRSARLQLNDENTGGGSYTMVDEPSPIMKPPTFSSRIFPLPIRLFGSSGYSYPGIGAEEEGYTDQEFYENISIAVDETDETVAQTINSAFYNVLRNGDNSIDATVTISQNSMSSFPVAKSTEYPPTELGVAIALFLIMNNTQKLVDSLDAGLNKIFDQMRTDERFGCVPPLTRNGTNRFEQYIISFNNELSDPRKKNALIRYIQTFLKQFNTVYPNCEIHSIALKGKSADSTDTADVSCIINFNGQMLNVALDIKQTEKDRQSNLSVKKIYDNSGYWTTTCKPLHNALLAGIPRIKSGMNDAEKIAIRQECKRRLIDKSTPFWSSLMQGIALNASALSQTLINYLCPTSAYNAVYKFRGNTLEKSKDKSDIMSFNIYNCPRLETKINGQVRNDVKMHFLCIIEFNHGTSRCFDLQLMWKGDYHSPPFFVLFEINCDDYSNSDNTCIVDNNKAGGGSKAGGGGSSAFTRRGGCGSRKNKRKSLRRRKTRRSKKN
jgi:hypothetical protein